MSADARWALVDSKLLAARFWLLAIFESVSSFLDWRTEIQAKVGNRVMLDLFANQHTLADYFMVIGLQLYCCLGVEPELKPFSSRLQPGMLLPPYLGCLSSPVGALRSLLVCS